MKIGRKVNIKRQVKTRRKVKTKIQVKTERQESLVGNEPCTEKDVVRN